MTQLEWRMTYEPMAVRHLDAFSHESDGFSIYIDALRFTARLGRAVVVGSEPSPDSPAGRVLQCYE